MSGSAPKVSVIIATYNWSSALRCAIRSVRHQTLADLEVLVVGDGCTDDSEAVVASFGDPRFSWHNLPRNHGSQWAPNNFGLERSRGEWIAYLGHDDVWHPDHLAVTIAAAEGAGAGAAVATMIMYGPPRSGIVYFAGAFFEDRMSARDFVPPSGFVHRRDLVTVAGNWADPATLALQTDCEFQLRMMRSTRVAASNDLTVFKFAASMRRDAYLRKSVAEQEEMLRKIEGGGEFRYRELMGALRAAATDRLIQVGVAGIEGVGPGDIARACRRFKGTEARFSPDEMMRPEGVLRFGLEHLYGGCEWHAPERHPVHGDHRWSGPAPEAAVDLPVVVDRPITIRARVLGVLDTSLLRTMRISINDRPAEYRLEPVGDVSDLWVETDERSANGLSVGFHLDRVVRPVDLGLGADRRALGVAVSWIEIIPRNGPSALAHC